jgi:hypothetical protein
VESWGAGKKERGRCPSNSLLGIDLMILLQRCFRLAKVQTATTSTTAAQFFVASRKASILLGVDRVRGTLATPQ